VGLLVEIVSSVLYIFIPIFKGCFLKMHSCSSEGSNGSSSRVFPNSMGELSEGDVNTATHSQSDYDWLRLIRIIKHEIVV